MTFHELEVRSQKSCRWVLLCRKKEYNCCSVKFRHSQLDVSRHGVGGWVVLEGVGLARIAVILWVVSSNLVPLPVKLSHIEVLHLCWDLLGIELFHILTRPSRTALSHQLYAHAGSPL